MRSCLLCAHVTYCTKELLSCLFLAWSSLQWSTAVSLCLLPPWSCPMSWPSGCPSTSLHVLQWIHSWSPFKLNCIMEKILMTGQRDKENPIIWVKNSMTQTLRRSWSIMTSQPNYFNIILTATRSGHWNTLACTCAPFSMPGQRLQDTKHIIQSIA